MIMGNTLPHLPDIRRLTSPEHQVGVLLQDLFTIMAATRDAFKGVMDLRSFLVNNTGTDNKCLRDICRKLQAIESIVRNRADLPLEAGLAGVMADYKDVEVMERASKGAHYVENKEGETH